MANVIYATINGEKQGLISAGCSSVESIGNKYQQGHEDQIYVYASDHEISRGSHVNHHPVVITKPIDKSSPLLGVSISNNEKLQIELDFYRNTPFGGMELFYKIKLKDAYIDNITLHYPNALTHNDMQAYETVSVNYKSIDWQHVCAGTSGYSIWDERVY